LLLLALLAISASCLSLDQSVALSNGLLTGLGLETSPNMTSCFVSTLQYKNLAAHDWSKLIFWQSNPIKPIPEVNATLVQDVLSQVFDDS